MLYNNNKHCEAKEILTNFYKRKNKLPDGYFDLAKSIYLCDSSNEDSYRYFELGITKNGIPLKFYKQLETDSLFSNKLSQNKQWQLLISNYPKLFQEYETSLNLDLKKLLTHYLLKIRKLEMTEKIMKIMKTLIIMLLK